ncbi:MAG: HlyC/CorC family transporter [Chloroflexota bacterium]|nr:MAG: HlyC/CorC family transporter [Chloroflexota bacterium]
MTELQLVLAIFLGLMLVFDLLATAARIGLENANLVRLMGPGEHKESEITRTIQLLSTSSRARASLSLAQGLMRFIAAGLAILVFVRWTADDLPIWQVLAVMAATALVWVWLEWLIETQVKKDPEAWSIRLRFYIQFWMILLYPFMALTFQFTPESERIEAGNNIVTEDELKSMVDAGQQEGLLEQDERKMIYSIFRLGDTLAREIMIPRIDMTAVDVKEPLEQVIDNLLRSGYSRVPVYEETIDHVLGLLYTKDLLRVWREGNSLRSLRELLRPAYFVPEAKKVDELLAEMQSRRVHMAVVVDEYGGVAGVVTLEDIVEEIVGEIQDEFDQAEESPYQEISDGEYVFQGRVGLDDFNEVMGTLLPSEEADTLGGFIYNRVGRVPNAGESMQVDNLLLTVEQVSGRRIRKVRAQHLPLTVESTEEKTDAN